MHNIRCQCGKIVCQVANLPEPPKVRPVPCGDLGAVAYILCRHCKRYVVLQVPTVSGVTYAAALAEPDREPFLAVRS